MIEDEESHAELVRRPFEENSAEWGIYHVVSICEALKWLEESKNNLPSLVISDYRLPDGTGLDIAKGARWGRSRRKVANYFHTASVDEGITHKSYSIHKKGVSLS